MPRRVNFATVIALIALFVSLGGGVYAASKLNGKKIKNASIAGSKLKADTLGGAQIDESSLGAVPSARTADNAKSADAAKTADSARTADSAKTADSASTLAGSGPGAFVAAADVKRFHFDVAKVSTNPNFSQTVLQAGPLKLDAECDFGDFPGDAGGFVLRASTSAPSAGFDVGYVRSATAAASNGGFVGSAPVTVLTETITNGFNRLVGTFVYNDATTTITVPFTVFLNDTNSETRCFFTGTATKATG